MKPTTYSCPLCNNLMMSIPGTVVNAHDGITVFCNGPNCPANENVQGHGKTEAGAYEIIIQKYKKI
jgi:transcription elongation factor Elf1